MLPQHKFNADVTVVQVTTIVGVLALLGWMDTARLVRGQFLTLLNRDFVLAARALGADGRRIMLVHLIPNSMAPIIVAASLNVGAFIITESAISFLGVGVSPPTASWGSMLAAFQSYLRYSAVAVLRPDGRWSDGQPVTAAQFEYSWKRILDPALKAEYAAFFVNAGVVGADDYNSGRTPGPDNVGV